MEKEISEKAKQTAKHIGIISEGAIQTLIDEIRAEEKGKLIKEIVASYDWILIPRIKISELKQHLRKICGMDSLEDIKKLNKLVDRLENKEALEKEFLNEKEKNLS